MKTLVTEASGFIGKALVEMLLSKEKEVIPVLRKTKAESHLSPFMISDINSTTEWSEGLCRIDVVIHCAARVHV